MKHIVVPLDRSPVSESVLPIARGLSTMPDSAVSLITVIEASASLPADQGDAPEYSTEALDDQTAMSGSLPTAPGTAGTELAASVLKEDSQVLAEADAYLKRIAETFPGQRVQSVVLYGDPVRQVLEFVTPDERHASVDRGDEPVIAMASHGRSGLGRVLVGSVAWRVIQRADCPVFLVRGREDPAASAGSFDIEKVLVALDGSLFSENILIAIRRVLGNSINGLHLLRVIDPEGDASEADEHSEREEARRYLRAVSEWMTAQGYSVTWEVGQGEVDRRIGDAAEGFGADVVALATHARKGVSRLSLGSVTEKVVREADRPLMIVRPRRTD